MPIFEKVQQLISPKTEKKYVPIWEQIQSEIDYRREDITHYLQAIAQHTPSELLQTLKQSPDYIALYAKYFEKITELQNRLDGIKNLADTQRVATKKEKQAYKELLEQGTSDLEKNSVDVFQQLSQHMSGLLHCFANVLLARMENKESFSFPIDDIRIAVLIDALDSGTQSVELTATLKSIIESKNLPKPCNDQLVDILTKIKFSPQNTPIILAALQETIKPVIEPAQTRVDRIINQRLSSVSPEACIATLSDELSDQFHLEKFTAFFTSFTSTDHANQKLAADIHSRLTALEAHAPNCKPLQTLIADCHDKLHDLQSDAVNQPTLDNHIELTTQLTQLKNDLETGPYFKTAQKKVFAYLTNLQKNVMNRVQENRETIQTLLQILRNDNSGQFKQIIQLDRDYEETRLKIESWLEDCINNYPKLTTLNEIINFGEISIKQINEIHTPVWIQISQYQVALDILTSANYNKENPIFKEIDDSLKRTALIKSLTDKLFLSLRTAAPRTQNHFLEKLTQFLDREESQQQPSDAFLLFKKELRESMTEKCLANFYKPNSSFGEICELFNDFITAEHKPLLVTPEARDWFDATKEAIQDFQECSENVNNKRNSYTPSFFLKGDDSKQRPIEQLKAQLADLPLNATKQALEETFKQWETEFGADIDKPRYHAVLAKLMEIFHNVQTLFGGKVFTTETRNLVNRLKEQALNRHSKPPLASQMNTSA